MKKILFLLIAPLLMLNSCIEIIDDLSLNLDGSGTFKYTVNLSSSKVKVNSILALDSFNGKKVPKIEEIESKINQFRELLTLEKGIKSVQTEFNKVDFIAKITVDFSSLEDLQAGIKSVLSQLDPSIKYSEDYTAWITWDFKSLKRMIPQLVEERIKNETQSDQELLNTGSYTCISRLPKSILNTSNSACKLNPTKTAAMLRVNTWDLKLNPSLLEHTLTLSP
jgi:hypothetical protein